MTEAPCGCIVPVRDGCQHCDDGSIVLPAALYDPASIPCPWCQPQHYPDGFPGLKAQPEDQFGHWLIEPTPAR